MNKRSLYIGLAYSISVIIFKLIILYGGFALTKFGFNYSHIISVFCIAPFLILAIKYRRDKDLGGLINGKLAFQTAMAVTFIAAVVLSVYSYLEFDKWKELSPQYYSGEEFHKKYEEYYLNNPTAKKETFESVVQKNVMYLNAFQFMTVRLISLLFIGISTSFIGTMFMKKK